MLGEAAGSVGVGVRRIQVPAGAWSTPAHEHGSEEEIFYVLSGRGVTWQREQTTEIGARDCIVYHAGGGAHSLHALEPLDVLAFGPRHRSPGVSFPRLGMSLVGRRAVESLARGARGRPDPVRPRGAGRPAGAPGRARAAAHDDRQRRRGAGPGGRAREGPGPQTGPRRRRGVEDDRHQAHRGRPGKDSSPQHCHSLEEELFVVLDGDGVLVLGDEETPGPRRARRRATRRAPGSPTCSAPATRG